MKIARFPVYCTAVYHTELEVPDELEGDELVNYLYEHLELCDINDLEWVADDEVEPINSDLITIEKR